MRENLMMDMKRENMRRRKVAKNSNRNRIKREERTMI
jgi:hypothetical protein